MYSKQEALQSTPLAWYLWTEVQIGVTVCVFRSVVKVCCAEEGMGGGGGGGGQHFFFESGMLTTKYPGAVRDQFQQIIFKRDSSKQ